ncbi:MAG: T9SS type A sorting domain-containing protein [Ignavibacteria bacterium]|nr:T9SS type A sorting domain-containing protein [Ignavibacteria bacterium]
MPKEWITKLVIFDTKGRKVSILLDKQLEPGTYEIDWDASMYSRGIYFYTLKSGDFKETKKMILIK